MSYTINPGQTVQLSLRADHGHTERLIEVTRCDSVAISGVYAGSDSRDIYVWPWHAVSSAVIKGGVR